MEASQHAADLGNHDLRPLKDIRGGESEQAVARVQEQVLAAVVGHEPLPMVSAIELDHEPRGGVVEIRTPDKSPGAVMKLRLHLGPG